MLRGNSRRRVKPKLPNGWVTGKNHPAPIRRRLRDATLWDRFLIAAFFFIASALATGFIYWYLSQPNSHTVSYRSYAIARLADIVTPMERLTGTAARIHYLIVCLAGGIAGALGYIAVTLADPYGTTAAAKAEEKRKRDRFEFLSQNRGFADSKTDDSDSNHEKPPAG